jgi:hypothetical protein
MITNSPAFSVVIDKLKTPPPSVNVTEQGVLGSPGLSADAVEVCDDDGPVLLAEPKLWPDAEVPELPHPVNPTITASIASQLLRTMLRIFSKERAIVPTVRAQQPN